MSHCPPETILCATQRLVRHLRVPAGATGVVAVRDTATLAQWLDRLTDAALLSGHLSADAVPIALSARQEELLWRQIIEASLGAEAVGLFDLDGLAASAAEANALVEEWRLPLPDESSIETDRFKAWRKSFQKHCAARGLLEPVRFVGWQIAALRDGRLPAPVKVAFAGFETTSPTEKALRVALMEQGVDVTDWPLPVNAAPQLSRITFDDATAELRHVARWAADCLKAVPQARIGIVIPELSSRRTEVVRVFDEILAPYALVPELAQAPRPYNVSLGVPLAQWPSVAAALTLLGWAPPPQGLEQTALGNLLTGPFLGRADDEADDRARLDARLRKQLPLQVSLKQVVRVAKKAIVDGIGVRDLANRLERLQATEWPRRAAPSVWGQHFDRLLRGLGWPGQRALSSHDFQAVEAWRQRLSGLAEYDLVLGEIPVARALALLRRDVQNTLFQPKTEGQPPIQLLGLLEAAGESFDALWVTGMNDAVWPPPPRPNPLLPAALQREQGCPNGSPEIQFDFALRIHRRLRQAAPEVIFSSVRREGERALRESPLLTLDADVLTREILSPPPPSLIAQLQTTRHQPLVALDDAQAPPVGPDEALRGGTGALKAQAICPAWSFYQYRLGARALEVPVEGLDARGRGSAVHAVLEQFWRGRSLSEVRAWDGDRLAMEIDRAVVAGLAQFEEEAGEPLPAAFRALEAARLAKLLGRWVALELTRPVDFVVVACETEHVIDIDGLRAKVVVDRIDQLDDGRLFILDYKTGKKVDASSWPSARIAEPQLPIYASLLDHHDPVAGIAFAQVLLDEPRFTGIAESPALLPKVLGLDEAWKKGWDEAEFPDWGSVRAHWTAALRALVAEIRFGGAATVFSRVEELKYCDVAPVLRLAERHQQYSEALAAALNAPSNEASA